MDKHTIFQLNKMADEYEEKARSYRAVANDLMNGTEHQSKPRKRKKVANRQAEKNSTVKGYKYKPGTHWMQKPENMPRVMKIIRKMHRIKKGSK